MNVVMSAVIVITLLTSGIGVLKAVSSPSSINPQQAEKLYLKVAMQSDIKTLNPSTAADVWTWKVLCWLWDEGVVEDPDTLEVKPWVALEWRNWTRVDEKGNVVGDYMNWTITYRTGYYNTDNALKFSDGHVVDIYDILFSYAFAMRAPRWAFKLDAIDKTPNLTYPNGQLIPPEDGAGKYGGIPMVKGIELVDDHTLRFKLNFTYAEFETDILGVPIFPWHAWKDHFNPYDRSVFERWDMDDDGNPANGAPGMISSGLFKFVKWDKSAFYSELATNKEYFSWNKKPPNWNKDWYWEKKIERYSKKPCGKLDHTPPIDGLQFKLYMKTDLAVMALKRGDVDYIAWSIDPGYIPELEKDPNIGLATTPGTDFVCCAFNMHTLPFGYDKGKDVGLPLRKAIAYATPLPEPPRICTSPISPAYGDLYNPNVSAYPYDLEKARKILDEQGWTDKDGNGWRELPGVGDAQLTLIHPTADYDYISRAEPARMLAESLRKINLNVRNQPIELGELINRLYNRDMNFSLLRWRGGTDVEPYLSKLLGYCNKSYDEVIDAARKELDPIKRRALIWKLQEIITGDLPYNVLYYDDLIECYRKTSFVGWYSILGGIFNMWSLIYLRKTGVMMNLSLSVPDAVMAAGKRMDLTLFATDKNDKPIASAQVNITVRPIGGVSPGSFEEISGYPLETGSISEKSVTIKYAAGSTKSAGEFRVRYVAPTLKGNETLRITFSATAYKEGYLPAFASSSAVDIYPPVAKVLKVKATLGSEIIASGGNTTVTAEVVDLLDNPIGGVRVSVFAYPATGWRFDERNKTTDQTGIAKFIFTAQIPEDTESEEYSITVFVDLPPGWLRAYSDTKEIIVKQIKRHPPEGFNALYVIVPAVGIVAVVAVVVVVCYLKRRKL